MNYFSDFFKSNLRFASIKANAKLTIANGALELSPKPVSLSFPCLALVEAVEGVAVSSLAFAILLFVLSLVDLPSTFTLPVTPSLVNN